VHSERCWLGFCGRASRFVAIAGRTASPLVGCPKDDALLEVVALDVEHVAPGLAIEANTVLTFATRRS
jgi:hypothetical protein